MGSEHLKWDLAAPNARLLEPMPIAQDGRLEGDAKSQLQLEESTSDSEEVQEPSYSPSYSPDYEPDSVLHAKNSRVYRLGFLQQLTDNKLDSLADKVTKLAVTTSFVWLVGNGQRACPVIVLGEELCRNGVRDPYILSSVYKQCLETATAISRGVSRVPICLEYGLSEGPTTLLEAPLCPLFGRRALRSCGQKTL